MRTPPSIISLFVILIAVCVGSQAHLVSAREIPADLYGDWMGRGVQSDGAAWDIKLSIKNDVIEVSYPTLRCGRIWERASSDERSGALIVSFVEIIKYGMDICLDRGEFEITWVRGEKILTFSYYKVWPPVSATGEMRLLDRVQSSPDISSEYSAGSFKRKMCELTKVSENMKASFMQSISRDELVKFLKSGQDCSVF